MMKFLYQPALLLVAALGIAFGYTFFNTSNIPTDSNQLANLDYELRPAEEYFLQRSYSGKKFGTKAYTSALKATKQQILSKSGANTISGDWVTQGPGNIGARINTVAVHPTDDDIMYVGFSQGGAFKTIDGGDNWFPIFDDFTLLSIGEIVLDPSDPNTVYMGTGDPNISGYPFIGDGIYKSTDAGATWTNLGLEETRIISKIIVDPTDQNTIYVATMGIPFERNDDRGLYKTTDGGVTWEQVLFLNNESGIIDMVMDTDDPQTIYAAGWTRIRNNNESKLNSEVARVYKSTDGGANWTTLGGGLPQGELSRIGLAISATDGQKLYAMVIGTDQQIQGIYRTTDGGDIWTPVSTTGLSTNAMGGFGWYFGRIDVNPTNDEQLYVHGVSFYTLRLGLWTDIGLVTLGLSPHADKHDLVFNSSGELILATDGGLYKTADDGLNWTDLENIPTTQFYRVGYNPHLPNTYYGGAQDNGTTGGNKDNINDWERILGADGFQPIFHPTNPDVFYAETQNGGINVTQNGGTSFSGATSGIPGSDRRHWDMQYFISPFDADVLYTGTFRVYKSTAGAAPSWNAISPDLTDGIESNFHLISAITESTLQQGLLYVGTNDGNVWRTDDDGANWINVTGTLPDRYVSDVTASPDNLDNVYVTHTGYKDGDFTPRIFRSTDRGVTWEDISTGLPNLAVNCVYVIPGTNDQTIFIANDGGVYGTTNGGQSWKRVGDNMPMIPVYDLEYNVANNEIVAATFARSIQSFSLDNIQNDALAVEWLDFSATAQKNEVLLTWTTANEVDSPVYFIEKSIDALNYETIGQVNGKGKATETNAYTFTDIAPQNGRNYYRIQQTDELGRKSYTPTQVVNFAGNDVAFTIKIYPNPTTDNLQIDLTNPATGTGFLLNTQGQRLQQLNLQKGSNEVSLEQYPAGIYYVEMEVAGERVVRQVVKR